MRDLRSFSVLIHPGLGGAGEDHWQTHWERAFPDFVRVQQADWEQPVYDDWAARLTEAVDKAPRPVVLVPHSAGTFFVAPSDRDRWNVGSPSGPRGFGGMILKRLPFPSAVVAGRDDDRVTFDRAQEFAKAWGSIFFDGGNHGHLGSAARLGLWPQGLVYFGQFLATL